MINDPPFELVQLSTLPETSWKGRAVFHPLEQRGTTAMWTITQQDVEDDLEVSKELNIDPSPMIAGDASYDVGVVLDWEPDPHFADLGVIRVHFIMSNGCGLRYSSDNLWTPAVNNA